MTPGLVVDTLFRFFLLLAMEFQDGMFSFGRHTTHRIPHSSLKILTKRKPLFERNHRPLSGFPSKFWISNFRRRKIHKKTAEQITPPQAKAA